jgi:putative Holliday junction resolvase
LNGVCAITILAFDFGLRHIGVAVGNGSTRTAQALTTLKAEQGIPRWDDIQALLDEWKPQLLVVGLPLNMDDSESELSRLAQKFGRRLNGRYALPVEYMDERLSSFDAKQHMREAGHKGDYKNHPADALAAELILSSWLESQKQ